MKKILLFFTGVVMIAILSIPFVKTSALTFLDKLEIKHNSTTYGVAHKFPTNSEHANVLKAERLDTDNRATIYTRLEKKRIVGYERLTEYTYEFNNNMINIQYPHRYGVYDKGTYRYFYSTKTTSGYYGSFYGTAEAFGI